MPDRSSRVVLQIPADSAFVAILRSVTAGLAARCDLTLDDIEDLRIAVDEACALLLPHATPAAMLDASFGLTDGSLEVVASVPAPDDSAADRSGFAWTVLGALASHIDVAATDGRMSITLVKTREATSAGSAFPDSGAP